jgi:membrane associated rhomboid family serine protease
MAALLGFFAGPDPSSFPWGVSPPTIGASGAIFGIFMAYGMVFGERTILFMMIFPMKARTFAIIMAALALFNLLGQANDGVSHIAHVGGALTGFLYLKRTWRVGEFYRNLRWRMLRRKFKVMPPRDDDDRWVH